MEMAIRAAGRGAGLERLMYFLQVGLLHAAASPTSSIWSAIERDIEKIMQALEAQRARPRAARAHPQLSGAAARGVPPHDPPARRSASWSARVPRPARSSPARSSPTSRSSRSRPTRSPRCADRRGRAGPDASRTRWRLRQRQEQKRPHRLRARPCARAWPYDGVPMEIFLKRRHREKPKLITICDVSDSVRNASRFMLQLVWNLQECFSRVRSYVFVSEIAEVTPGVRHLSGRAGHRVGAQGRAGRLSLPLRLRLRLQPVRHHRAGVARPQDDDPAARRRPQQLQRPPGVGAAPHPRAGEGHHLAEPRGPVGLGHRRQRDAALRAGLRHRARVPHHRPAG